MGTTAVTRLIVTGADLLVPCVAMRPAPELVVMMTVEVKVPFGNWAGSIVMMSVIPSGGRVPLGGSIFTIQERSAVALNCTGVLSPGMKSCCWISSFVPAGTLTDGCLRLPVVGTMTTRMVREYGPGVFVQEPVARTR